MLTAFCAKVHAASEGRLSTKDIQDYLSQLTAPEVTFATILHSINLSYCCDCASKKDIKGMGKSLIAQSWKFVWLAFAGYSAVYKKSKGKFLLLALGAKIATSILAWCIRNNTTNSRNILSHWSLELTMLSGYLLVLADNTAEQISGENKLTKDTLISSYVPFLITFSICYIVSLVYKKYKRFFQNKVQYIGNEYLSLEKGSNSFTAYKILITIAIGSAIGVLCNYGAIKFRKQVKSAPLYTAAAFPFLMFVTRAFVGCKKNCSRKI